MQNLEKTTVEYITPQCAVCSKLFQIDSPLCVFVILSQNVVHKPIKLKITDLPIKKDKVFT